MNLYEKNLATLSKCTDMLKRELDRLHSATEDEERNSLLLQAALDGELLATNLRKLVINSSAADRRTIMKMVCEASGYDVKSDGDDTVIHIPPLPLKDRVFTNCRFIVDPLLYALELYTKGNDRPKYEKCLIRITHIFPDETPLRHVHDYDNLEVKKIIDAITVYLLIDDNMRRCNILHMSEIGETMKTEIRITPI